VRAGVDHNTGEWLYGWAHVVQSIQIILTTRIGSRIWRRTFGAAVTSIQDANAHPRTLLEFYRNVADALQNHEPGYRLETINLKKSGRDGVFEFELSGTYFPRGHLGDFSISEKRGFTSIVNDTGPGGIEIIAGRVAA